VLAKRPTITEILDIILAEGNRGGSPVAIASRPSGQREDSEQSRIAAVLSTRTADSGRANRIAAALVREGKRANLSSTLLVGVLLTENPDLEPRATSSVGARGLMQVMPLHAGQWGCPSADLFNIESNICHGVRILADDLRHSRDLPAALLRYNGCVRGTNTPDCYLYAGKVYRHARQSATGRDGVITASTPFSFLDSPRASPRQHAPSRKGVIVLPRDLLVD
jgi:soluble lytic murein transglycosylase-like protein